MGKKKKESIVDLENPIYLFIEEAAGLTRGLPFASLLPGEAKFLNGYLFRGAPLLVESLGLALIGQPEHFPGLAQAGEDLLRDQGQAVLWQTLIALLEQWLQRARESFTKEQSQVVKRALDIMARMDLEDRLWASAITQEQRNDPRWRREVLVPWLERQLVLDGVRVLLEKRKAMYRPGQGEGQDKAKKKKKKSPPLGREMSKALLETAFGKELKKK